MSRECFGCRLWPEDRGRCEAISGRWDQHHLLPKQVIRREFKTTRAEREIAALLADERNLVWVRRWHHDQIERRMRIVPFERLPPAAVAFAAELGLEYRLERLYPPGPGLRGMIDRNVTDAGGNFEDVTIEDLERVAYRRPRMPEAGD